MTYCFAWKYQDAVFLIADTLVTQSFPADRHMTSTGEIQRQVCRSEFVHERLLKVREIKAGTAVAFAGDVQLAIAITDFIQENIGNVTVPADVCRMVEASFGPFVTGRDVEILLIDAAGDGRCLIAKWDTNDGYREEAQCAHIGSLASDQAHRIEELFRRLMADKSPSKVAMLLAGLAFVISLSRHEDLIRQYVGGMVCGLWVQRAKTNWQDDLVIVFHKSGSIDGRVSMHVREGIVYINSTYHGTEGTVLIGERQGIRADELVRIWRERHFSYLKDYLGVHFTTCTRWLFIDLDRQVPLVFVVHGRLEQAKANLRIERAEEGYRVIMDSDLASTLRRDAPSAGPELRIVEAANLEESVPDGMYRS